MHKKIAIIDIGSNSIRMNILDINVKNGYSIFDSAKEIPRLCEGLYKSNYLQQVPIERTIKVLHYFKKILQLHEVETTYTLCTLAIRKARNQQAFLERVKEELDMDIRVLNEEEEAYYDYLGVVNSMSLEEAVLIDIGGGSTEIIWMENREFKEYIVLPFGSVTLTEMFSDVEPKKKRIEKSMKYLEAELSKVEWLEKVKRYPIIGIGGIARTLSKIDKNMHNYPILNLHNYHLTVGEAEFLFDKIFMKADGRENEIEGIDPRRGDVITLGLMPLYTLVYHLEATEMYISGNGLRDGFFYEQYFKNLNLPCVVEDVLVHSYENLIKRFSVDEEHGRHVQKLALGLFDQLNDIHEFDFEDRKALEIASLLHDIGMQIEYYDHHLHGMYMLLYSRINGLRIKEHLKVAFLIGEHRTLGIQSIVEFYRIVFTKKELKHIENLSIFLKIGEQLDRSSYRLVEGTMVQLTSERVVIRLLAKEYPELEMAAVERQKEAFEKVFNRKCYFQHEVVQ